MAKRVKNISNETLAIGVGGAHAAPGESFLIADSLYDYMKDVAKVIVDSDEDDAADVVDEDEAEDERPPLMTLSQFEKGDGAENTQRTETPSTDAPNDDAPNGDVVDDENEGNDDEKPNDDANDASTDAENSEAAKRNDPNFGADDPRWKKGIPPKAYLAQYPTGPAAGVAREILGITE